MIENLRKVYEQSDSIDREAGLVAYESYHSTLACLAHQTELPLSVTVGVFAALSPNSDYLGNLRGAITLCRAFREGKSLYQVNAATYGHCRYRAWEVLRGRDFLGMTEGKKTRAFYLNILEPENPEPVTVDGHIFAARGGGYRRMKESKPSPAEYDKTAGEVRELAREAGLVPNQMQATLWFTWKRLHAAVRGDGQLALNGDHWNLLPDVSDLKTFQPRPEPVQLTLFERAFQPQLF